MTFTIEIKDGQTGFKEIQCKSIDERRRIDPDTFIVVGKWGTDEKEVSLIEVLEKPGVVVISDVGDKRLRVVDQIRATLYHDEEAIVAGVEEANAFGFGATREEAIDRLKENLVDSYFVLESEKHRLSEFLNGAWHFLESKIKKL